MSTGANPSLFTPLPGYPQPWGTKIADIGDLYGPASYVNPGGQVINASQFGMGGIEKVEVVGLSYSGTYYVRIQILPTQNAPSLNKGPVSQVALIWYVLSTGNQVANGVDLSGECIRLEIIGV